MRSAIKYYYLTQDQDLKTLCSTMIDLHDFHARLVVQLCQWMDQIVSVLTIVASVSTSIESRSGI